MNVDSHQLLHQEIRRMFPWYADTGLPIIPLCPHDHEGVSNNHSASCTSPGKVPLIAKWTTRRTPDPLNIEDWLNRCPDANIGLVLGTASGIVAIDVDGVSGAEMLQVASAGDLPPTWSFTTPGGGRRLLYSIPAGKVLKKHTITGSSGGHEECALLGEGQQTVLPPSIHANGGVYQWEPGRAPWEAELAEAPLWMVQLMTERAGRSQPHMKNPDPSAENVLQTLSAGCPRFCRDWAEQQEDGVDEERWFRWVSLLTRAGFPDSTRVFSLASPKHGERSERRLEQLINESVEKPFGPVRCTTFGCDSAQIAQCFGHTRSNDNGEVTNSPAALLTAPAPKEDDSKPERPPQPIYDSWVESFESVSEYGLDSEGNTCVREGEEKLTPIANFVARVNRQEFLDDGVDSIRVFQVEGVLSGGQPLPTIRVTSEEFPHLGWVLKNWGIGANIRPGFVRKDQVRDAIQSVSRFASETRVYTRLGWRDVGGKWAYLHAGGAVGAGDVSVEPDGFLGRYTLPNEVADPLVALHASIGLLDVAPRNVTVPLLGLVYLAPLCEPLRRAGREPNFVLWLHGRSGTRKTSLGLLALCHFGRFGTSSPPASFKDTANAIERRAFGAKDSLLLIDDYHPSGSSQDTRRMEQTAQYILRLYGDRIPKGRLTSTTQFRAEYSPRGMALVTGEDTVGGESSVARYLGVELRPGDIDLGILTRLQGESELLAAAMRGYVEWLTDKMPDLPATLNCHFEEARTRMQQRGQHGRLASAAAWLHIGYRQFLENAVHVGAVSRPQADELLDECTTILVDLTAAQSRSIAAQKPGERFLRVLSELLAAGTIYTLFAGRKDDWPTPDRGEHIGWQDDEFYYLLPEKAYNAVSRFLAAQHESFPVSAQTLWRHLEEEEAIRTEMETVKGGGTRTQRLPKKQITSIGKRLRLLHIKRAALDQEPEDE